MRVNAGDCVILRYVNALAETSDGAGLPDGLGDALAPRITPLNLDPVPSVERIAEPGSTRVEGALEATTVPVTGLRPSARLGLSIGLPSAELIRDLPLGYGVNREALAPAACSGPADPACVVVASKPFGFYAGRLRIALPAVTPGSDPLATLANEIGQELAALFGATSADPQLAADPDKPDFVLLGRGYDLNLTPSRPLTETERAEAQRVADLRRDAVTHWIPYAFGPAPVRPTGDVVSQAVHGLFGTIDVVPEQWALETETIPEPEGYAGYVEALNALSQRLGDPDRFHARPWRTAGNPKGFGAPLALAAELSPKPGETEPVRIREFVIFVQDGLNHLDERRGGGLTGSRIGWSLSGDGEPVQIAARNFRGPIPPLTPDCLICDDSYDLGEQGVSYRSRPFATLLRPDDIAGSGRIEASDDLNALLFPREMLEGFARDDGRPRPARDWAPLTLEACTGEQVVIRVVHPGGRARQHAFVMNGLGYDDLFPGFGFPSSALLGPGKAISAWLHPPAVLGGDGTRQPVAGTVAWHDGPSFLMAGGIWGLVSFGDAVAGEPCAP
jgi:manganese oxidase